MLGSQLARFTASKDLPWARRLPDGGGMSRLVRIGHHGHVTECHRSPEAAALSHWTDCPAAEAYVVRVEYLGPEMVKVVTDTNPSHPMNDICRRTKGGWVITGGYS